MKVLSSSFHTSAPGIDTCPRWDRREIAFAGRSNVGKSSLINLLANRSGLAKVSALPGKTRLINFFIINDSWSLVDLPGYGFAKVARGQQHGFSEMIRDYVSRRANLAGVCVLADSRLPPQKNDLSFIEWLDSCAVPYTLAFTKADKQSPAKTRAAVDQMLAAIAAWRAAPPALVVTSSKSSSGRGDLLAAIGRMLEG